MSDNSFASINFNDPESAQIFEYQSKMMCPQYKTLNESGFVVNIKVKNNESNNSLMVSGSVNINSGSNLFIKYSAANPPTYNSNFTGSGLPYPSEDIAYENTPNRGVVPVVNGNFSFSIRVPNSYYINMGTVFVDPHVKLILVNKDNKQIGDVKVVEINDGVIPFRTLSFPTQRNWNEGSLFYKNDNLPVRTQNQILLDSAYPDTNKKITNFWGLKPSN